MIERLWSPSQSRVDATNLKRFMAKTGHIGGYDELWDWSITDIEGFWDAAWDFLGIIGDRSGPVLRNGDDLESARFFPSAKMNLAENLLQNHGESDAIIFHGENGVRRTYSYDELRIGVAKLQDYLKSQGVGVGDRVAGFVPNTPEASLPAKVLVSLIISSSVIPSTIAMVLL